MNQSFQYDVLIIGSGAAGLTLAMSLAKDAKVAILSKGEITEGSTYYAQGGIAAVLDDNDTVESHVEDTMIAGAYLCRRDAVEFTARNGRSAIQWLIDTGVQFTKLTEKLDEKKYHLTREGGHSHRRIIHAADATGREVETTLVDALRNHENITTFEQHIAVDLITGTKFGLGTNRCIGAYVLNRNSGEVEAIAAKNVVLATGGASKVYLYTSNPDIASGDGIAMAWRAGCRIANMEFNQFHPTCLYHPDARNFLITEALRGEGAHLKLPNGERFMNRFDQRLELAPRDVVARAIDHEMKRLGCDCLYLDISHKPRKFITEHFPTIYEKLQAFNIDITKDPIPVVPAAHYTCGGVMTDLHGQTDIPGLYAVGEVACTGLHGANRMASNSLLECLVFAQSAANHIQNNLVSTEAPTQLPAWDESQVTDSDEEVVVSHNWDELRRFMWDYVGIVRTTKRLERAKRRVDLLKNEIHEYYGNFKVTNDLLELRNLVQVGELIINCALKRRESRGLHYTLDYPETLDEPKDSVLTPSNSPLANKD
jgi:L-aspartate oxidase